MTEPPIAPYPTSKKKNYNLISSSGGLGTKKKEAVTGGSTDALFHINNRGKAASEIRL